MEQKLYDSLVHLKSVIENDDNVLELERLSKEMDENDEVKKLSYQKDIALMDYEDSLKHFSKDSKEVKDAQKRLAQAKLALDEHPLVHHYLEVYSKVRQMYDKINLELFHPFR